MRFLIVMFGGGLGSLFRYIVSGFIYRYFDGIFPWGTFGVNIIGSFIIGFLWNFLEYSVVSSEMKLFLLMGFLGGFTTFSSYSLETFNLLRDGETGMALVNIFFSNIACITLVIFGFVVSKYFLSLIR